MHLPWTAQSQVQCSVLFVLSAALGMESDALSRRCLEPGDRYLSLGIRARTERGAETTSQETSSKPMNPPSRQPQEAAAQPLALSLKRT